MAEALATAEDLRVWMEFDSDDELQLPADRARMLIEGVSAAVLAYCDRNNFGVITDDEIRVDGNGSSEILLPGAPIVDVTSVVEDPDGAATVLEVGTDVEWSAAGVLHRVGGVFVKRPRWYEVTWSHGYSIVPEDVRNTVLRVAARAVVNPEGLATEGIGGYNAGFAFDSTRLPVLSPPDRRELDAYRLR